MLRNFHLSLFFLCCVFVAAQNQPVINTTTILPQNPTTADDVMIITSVVTPAQGHRIFLNSSVSDDLYRIELLGCYYSGLQPATETHIDTLHVGKLKNGYYVVNFVARLSDEGSFCNPVDSNSDGAYINVDIAGNVAEQNSSVFRVYFNQLEDCIELRGTAPSPSYRLFSGEGKLIARGNVNGGRIQAAALPPGMYFVEVRSVTGAARSRFLKLP